MSGALGFMSAVFFSAYFIIALFLFAVWLDRKESSGWAAFLVSVSILMIGWQAELSWIQIGIALLAYIPAGLAWSIWRWKRYCKRIVNEFKRSEVSTEDASAHARKSKEKLKPSQNIQKLIGWTVAWPVSMASTLFGDIIDGIETFIRERLIGIYRRISSSAINEIDAHEITIVGDEKTQSDDQQLSTEEQIS